MNVKQRDGLKAKLAELDGLAEERAAVNQRIAAIDERSAVLAAQRDAIKERLLPLYDQPEHDRVERILAGLGVEMTPSDEAARRRSENQSLRDEQAQLERDIGLLGEEKTRCEKKAEEIAANDEHARRAFLKQLGAALIDDYKAAANDLVFGIVFPILAINNGLDALGGRGQVIGVVNDLRISW